LKKLKYYRIVITFDTQWLINFKLYIIKILKRDNSCFFVFYKNFCYKKCTVKKKDMDYKNSAWFAPVIKFAENSFKHAKGSHGWDHTQRVVKLCAHIGYFEKVDTDVLLCAAYLHDIGRTVNNESICHGKIGSEMAEPIICNLFSKQ
jgi:putative nucleotidyltransferase with HDIG domain